MSIGIAMWSGPRNISTAMMRSFENRADTVVVDEPFYACYLHTSGMDHPMREEVIASQSTDWREVAAGLSVDREGVAFVYQKHMTHHMLSQIDLDWAATMRNCFLIRDPASVVSSYVRKRDSVTEQDIGIKRQYQLYQDISSISGQEIPVIDTAAFLSNPERGLRSLCELLGVPFCENMLGWPVGRRSSDGVWASHWYQAVEQSTGFQATNSPPTTTRASLSSEQRAVVDEADEYYQRLLAKAVVL